MMSRTDFVARQREAGFSAVEALILIAVLGMATLSMAHTTISGQRSLTHMEDDSKIFDQAQVLMSRLAAIPFGTGSEPAASQWNLGMLVSIENDLFGSPFGAHNPNAPTQFFTGANVTLTQVRAAQPLEWQYAVGNSPYYGGNGQWRVIVDRDLNGDGDLADPMEVQTQLSQDLFRIEIQYEGRRILRTIRSRNPSE